jgi:hypothetical protein
MQLFGRHPLVPNGRTLGTEAATKAPSEHALARDCPDDAHLRAEGVLPSKAIYASSAQMSVV